MRLAHARNLVLAHISGIRRGWREKVKVMRCDGSRVVGKRRDLSLANHGHEERFVDEDQELEEVDDSTFCSPLPLILVQA